MVDVAAQFGTSYTWGVSGPAFLVLYGVLVAVTGLAVLLLRRRWDQPELIVHEPGGPEEAVLIAAMESDDRAVLVAMMRLAQDGRIRLENTALSEAGILASPPGLVPRSAAGRLRQLGPATTVYPRGSRGPQSASELELRIHTLVATAPGSLVTTIRKELGSGPELAALRGRLIERGLVRTPATMLRLRLVAALFLVPLAIALVRIMAGKPGDVWLASAIVATAVAFIIAASVVGRLTPRGRRVKAAVRRAVPKPKPKERPESDYRDLDPLLVAVDGPTSLWGRDPAMTSMLAASYTSTAYWTFLPTAGATGGGGWGMGGGGGASCGGASCGGGGGSSCGGGSGCGGGSCGGGGCGGGGCGGG